MKFGKIARYPVAVAAVVLALALMAPSTFAGTARHASATRVKVTFSDSSFALSRTSLQSGMTTFVVLNKGKKHHLFSIKGPGIKSAHTTTLAAGRTARLTVNLRAGAYVLSDPVGLGVYNVQFLEVIHAASVTATGTSSIVPPPPTVPPMCGSTGYTP